MLGLQGAAVMGDGEGQASFRSCPFKSAAGHLYQSLLQVAATMGGGGGVADTLSHPRDRKGNLIKDRYATAGMEEALQDYRVACAKATRAVRELLRKLATDLQVHSRFSTGASGLPCALSKFLICMHSSMCAHIPSCAHFGGL